MRLCVCVRAQGFAERKSMDKESPESPGPAAYKMDDNAEAKIYTRYGKNCECMGGRRAHVAHF